MTALIALNSRLYGVASRHLPDGFKHRARRLQTRIKALNGSRYCPVCESRVSKFNRIPDFYVGNAQKYGFPFSEDDAETCNYEQYSCPFCEASDRDRLYALFLREYLGANSVTSIIDFAPSAPLSQFVRRLIQAAGQQISYRTADYFAEGVDDKVDIMDMPTYADGCFDFFICSHVLEHVADDRKALAELHRILKPGGKGILMVPIVLSITEIDEDPIVTDESERWRRFGQYDHVRLYSRHGFLERVRGAGFQISEYKRTSFGDGTFTRHGITDQSVLYVVEK